MNGETILHYKILEKLGEGGMGVVYLAKDTKLERKVAIKLLPHYIAINSEERERFKVEAKAAAALNHPNIATIYAIEESDHEIFLVMEYIDGIELKDKVKSGLMSTDDVIKISGQIAEGLESAHNKGIIHRDIKSQNIMITSDGKVKIMDFGLAKIKGGSQLTKIGSTIGTVAYMSPEQAKGEEVDQRTDIWALGVILYEMLTGKLPFEGDYEQAVIYSILNELPKPITMQRTDVPETILKISDRLLQKNPDQRYSSMKEILKDFDSVTKKDSKSQNDLPSSIAVLAFKDMSPQKDHDYLCEGLAEELINALTKIKSLRVAARTSAFAFKDKQVDMREIGSRLNVETLLEGSIQKSANRLRITAQLINVDDGYHIWSERYDREMKDVFEIQDDITENIVQALKMVLTKEEKQSIASVPTPEIEAFEYFLKGRRLLSQLALLEARDMFEKAVEKDPGYALAYSGLAETYSWIYDWEGANPEDLDAARYNSRKASELAPHLAESHISYGAVLSQDRQYEEAEKEFKKAIEIDPNSFEAHYYYARTCFARGAIEESAELFREAARVRLEDFQSLLLLSQSLRILGRHEEEQQAMREGIRRAEKQLELDPNDRRALSLGSGTLFELGEVEKAFSWSEKSLKLYPDETGVILNAVCLFARAGRKEEALDYAEKVFGKGFGKRDWIENDPDYDSLRDEPRFKALLEKLK
jgi:TolB-like protein/Tfp pilus assembly protein PilF/predicted Ser/Thr protein kinase